MAMFCGGGVGSASGLSARPRRWLVLPIVIPLAVLAMASQASSQGRDGVLTGKCAKVEVRARPKINAQTAPNETIKSKVTNCSSAKETVTLTQTIAGPFAAAPMVKRWTITLSPGKTAVRTRRLPYTCCGSYTVTDRVLARSGSQLAHARAHFTFA